MTVTTKRQVALGLSLCTFGLVGLTACGGGSSTTTASSGGSGSPATSGSAATAGYVFVADPNSGHLDSYPYTTTGTLGALANSQTPASFQSTASKLRVAVDGPDHLIFLGAAGASTNEEWSYLYNSTSGVLSGAQSNPSVAASGTPKGPVFDTVDHLLLSLGSTGIEAFPYNTTTGAVGTTASATSTPSGSIFAADPQNHFVFSYSGTTVSDYSLNPATGAIGTTAISSATIPSLSGATQVDNAVDVGHGILFVITQSAGAAPSRPCRTTRLPGFSGARRPPRRCLPRYTPRAALARKTTKAWTRPIPCYFWPTIPVTLASTPTTAPLGHSEARRRILLPRSPAIAPPPTPPTIFFSS